MEELKNEPPPDFPKLTPDQVQKAIDITQCNVAEQAGIEAINNLAAQSVNLTMPEEYPPLSEEKITAECANVSETIMSQSNRLNLTDAVKSWQDRIHSTQDGTDKISPRR